MGPGPVVPRVLRRRGRFSSGRQRVRAGGRGSQRTFTRTFGSCRGLVFSPFCWARPGRRVVSVGATAPGVSPYL
eukprot:11220687-Lingulodinium_polyedra.AAC.1